MIDSSEDYVDFEAIEEGLLDKYVEWCRQNNTKPRMSDFSIWKDDQEQFDRERDMDTARDAELDLQADREEAEEYDFPDIY